MVQKAVSLAVQLVLTLVGLVVVTTVALTVVSYRSFHSNLEDNARRMVRASADQAATTLSRLVDQQHARALGFLSSVESLCGEQPPSGRTQLESGCVSLALAEYRETERARGAQLESRGQHARAGAPIDQGPPGSPARIVTRPNGFDYVITASNGGRMVTIQFSVADLDALLRNHAVLGALGETFLTDGDGRFLTTLRYPQPSSPPSSRSTC